MPITALPTPPTTSDPENFDERADAFLAALPTFQGEANALETNVNAKEASTVAAVNAANAAGLANAAANAGTATTKAGEASTARDQAVAAKGAAETAQHAAEDAAAAASAVTGLPSPLGNAHKRLGVNAAGNAYVLSATETEAYVDKGSAASGTVTLDVAAAAHQRVQATGNITIALSNVPASGRLMELLVEAVNFGGRTITWPTVNWVRADGTTTTVTSSNGVVWQAAGTDFVLLWTRDGGTTIYGKVMR